MKLLRFLRPIKLINYLPKLKKTINSLFKSIPSAKQTLTGIFILMLFYSIFGHFLFGGLEENRCRHDLKPNYDVWKVDHSIKKYCGVFKCPDE